LAIEKLRIIEPEILKNKKYTAIKYYTKLKLQPLKTDGKDEAHDRIK